jgi:hypothetical protein
MVALKSLAFVTDPKGNKKQVMLSVADFERLEEKVEDLEDSLALEKAKKEATGFKRWKDFVDSLPKRTRG